MRNFIDKTFFLLFLQMVLFFSCARNVNSRDQYDYPAYDTDVLWELRTHFTDAFPNFTQEENYLYCGEKLNASDNYGFFSKINLCDGAYVWKSEELPFRCLLAKPLIIDNIVYIPTKVADYPCMYVLDKDSGNLLATLQLWNKDEEKKVLSSEEVLFFCNGKIYWVDSGVFMLDISKIDFFVSPNEIQIIIPERIWYDDVYGLNISIFPVCKDNILYFITYDGNSYNNDWSTHSRVIAFDLINNKELWNYSCKKLYGYGINNQIIVDDKLYIIEQGIGCFDLKTGKCYHESTQTKEDLMHEDDILGGVLSDGITYCDGKFFYTNTASWASSSMTGIPKKYIHNIICLDAKTLKIVWGQLPKGSGSQSACPTVINGKVFVPLCLRGLCVLDEKTGKILGIDTTIVSFGGDQSFSYNGVAYFMDYNNARDSSKENKTRLIAVRP